MKVTPNQDHRKCVFLRKTKGQPKCVKDPYFGCIYYNRDKEYCPNFQLKDY